MICVIGSRGLVGSAICRYFEREKVDFVGVNRENYQKHIGGTFDCVINSNGSGLKGDGNKNPRIDFERNVRSTLDLVFDFPSDLFVHVSSTDVYPDSSSLERTREDTPIDSSKLSPYGFDKYLSELIVQKYSPNWLILRLGGLVGEGLKKNPVYDWSHGKPFFISENSRLNFIHTDVVADIARQLIDAGIRREIINVCGTNSVRLKDLNLIHDFGTTEQDGELELQEYSINTDKLQAYYSLRKSEDYIKKYLRENLGI
jgi:nucleoside-diphosphate-sugar epimerase